MIVYRVRSGSREMILTAPADVDVREQLARETSIAHGWTPPKLVVVDDSYTYRGRATPMGDAPYWRPDVHVFSSRLRRAIEPMCDGLIEWLPVHIEGPLVDDDFFVAHVLRCIDCLDCKHSIIDRTPRGEIIDIRKYVFKADALCDSYAFRIAGILGIQAFVLDQVVGRATEADIRGAVFEAVWSDTHDCGFAWPHRDPTAPQSTRRFADPKVIKDWTDGELIDDWVNVLYDAVYREGVVLADSLASMPESLRMAYAAWLVWAEVGNGGFTQYFFNQGENDADDAVSAFLHIGAPDAAEVVRAAIRLNRLQCSKPEESRAIVDEHLSKNERTEAWEAFAELCAHKTFNELERERFEIICKAIHVQWADFVRAHVDDLVAMQSDRAPKR